MPTEIEYAYKQIQLSMSETERRHWAENGHIKVEHFKSVLPYFQVAAHNGWQTTLGNLRLWSCEISNNHRFRASESEALFNFKVSSD